MLKYVELCRGLTGCIKMIGVSVSCRKIYKIILCSFFIFLLLNSFFVCTGSSYVPYPPFGEINGTINVEYEYVVNTIEVGSFWMFDWGDGTFSEWIGVDGSDDHISANHSWDEYNEYNVRVKHKSAYSVESPWSSPLIVTISKPVDIDGDGWINEIEESYGKDPENSSEYPLDTDNDGTPDEDSLDGVYTGDIDDDDDGLSDVIESSLGSNSKSNKDSTALFVENTIFYLVRTNNDNYILYNIVNGKNTQVKYENNQYYLDINGDGRYDYTYDGSLKSYFDIPWLYIIVGVILLAIIIVFILFKKGILFLYEEEIVVEK